MAAWHRQSQRAWLPAGCSLQLTCSYRSSLLSRLWDEKQGHGCGGREYESHPPHPSLYSWQDQDREQRGGCLRDMQYSPLLLPSAVEPLAWGQEE